MLRPPARRGNGFLRSIHKRIPLDSQVNGQDSTAIRKRMTPQCAVWGRCIDTTSPFCRTAFTLGLFQRVRDLTDTLALAIKGERAPGACSGFPGVVAQAARLCCPVAPWPGATGQAPMGSTRPRDPWAPWHPLLPSGAPWAPSTKRMGGRFFFLNDYAYLGPPGDRVT